MEKTLGNSDASGTRQNVKDVVFFGNGDTWQLISKASSQAEGWMKSTKAMDLGRPGFIGRTGVVIQVTTQQRNPDGSYALAEAITYVPGAWVRTDPMSGERFIEA